MNDDFDSSLKNLANDVKELPEIKQYLLLKNQLNKNKKYKRLFKKVEILQRKLRNLKNNATKRTRIKNKLNRYKTKIDNCPGISNYYAMREEAYLVLEEIKDCLGIL